MRRQTTLLRSGARLARSTGPSWSRDDLRAFGGLNTGGTDGGPWGCARCATLAGAFGSKTFNVLGRYTLGGPCSWARWATPAGAFGSKAFNVLGRYTGGMCGGVR